MNERLEAPAGAEAVGAGGGGDDRVALTVVIPAYNEAGRLPATLALIGAFLRGHPEWLPAQIVVVDDGSRDRTVEAAAEVPLPARVRLEVVGHTVNLGKGAAVRSGFRAARGDLVLLSDADLSAPIEELDVLAGVGPERSVVIGSRAVNRELILIRQPWYRDLMGRTFNVVVRLLAVPGVRDTQCGFKLFPGRLARQLARVQRLNGFAYDVELLLLARRWGYPVREVAVRWRHVEASRVAPVHHSLQMLRDVVLLGWRRLTGALPKRAPEEPDWS